MSLSGIISRFPAREIKIGDRPLGGKNPIRLQSMTNTNTLDIGATVKQSIKIIEAGADYVRISAPSIEAANRLKEIKKGIRMPVLPTPWLLIYILTPKWHWLRPPLQKRSGSIREIIQVASQGAKQVLPGLKPGPILK
jgi:hypothetical protein